MLTQNLHYLSDEALGAQQACDRVVVSDLE
jgi:hypothetical protein